MSTRAVVQIREANKTIRTLFVHGDGHPESLGYSLGKVLVALEDPRKGAPVSDEVAMGELIELGLLAEADNLQIGKVYVLGVNEEPGWDIEFVYKVFMGTKSGVWKINGKEGPLRNEGRKVFQGTPERWVAKREAFIAAGY